MTDDDLAKLAVDVGPGAFVPRKEIASEEALVRLHAQAIDDPSVVERYETAKADEARKARRRAARAARRRNRR